MPNRNYTIQDTLTLEALRSLDHNSLVTLLYEQVMPPLLLKTYLRDHIAAGFHHATVTKKDKMKSALENAPSVRSFIQWVRVATLNKARSELRLEVTRRKKLEKALAGASSTKPRKSDWFRDLAPEIMEKLIARLTATEQELLRMFLNGMKRREMAAALGWKPSTAWTRWSELKKKLFDILREKTEGEECE